jgi:hypothetical protein
MRPQRVPPYPLDHAQLASFAGQRVVGGGRLYTASPQNNLSEIVEGTLRGRISNCGTQQGVDNLVTLENENLYTAVH